MIKLGICNELFEAWDFSEVCETVKSIGYDGIELAPFTLAPLITDLSATRRNELRSIVREAGLETIGLHWLLAKTEGFYLTTSDPAVRSRTRDYMKRLIEATSDLGGTLMVLGSPKQRDLLPGIDQAAALGYAFEVLADLIPTLEAREIELCLEPLAPSETDFLNTCEQANALIEQLDHPRIKLHMDVKAQSSEPGTTVPKLIKKHAKQAGHFHAQDVNLQGPGMGEVEFDPILEALCESGYNRWVSVEVFDFKPGARLTAERSYATLRQGLDRALAKQRLA